MKKISIVVPVYYNHDNLLPLYADLKEKVLSKLDREYEIIFVDDGSKDDSYSVMKELAKIDSNIKTIRLSRNFGEHSAILAGLSQCTGDCAVRKAADLQEPSEMILDMIKKYDEGYKVVLATRADREEPITQKMFSNFSPFSTFSIIYGGLFLAASYVLHRYSPIIPIESIITPNPISIIITSEVYPSTSIFPVIF